MFARAGLTGVIAEPGWERSKFCGFPDGPPPEQLTTSPLGTGRGLTKVSGGRSSQSTGSSQSSSSIPALQGESRRPSDHTANARTACYQFADLQQSPHANYGILHGQPRDKRQAKPDSTSSRSNSHSRLLPLSLVRDGLPPRVSSNLRVSLLCSLLLAPCHQGFRVAGPVVAEGLALEGLATANVCNIFLSLDDQDDQIPAPNTSTHTPLSRTRATPVSQAAGLRGQIRWP